MTEWTWKRAIRFGLAAVALAASAIAAAAQDLPPLHEAASNGAESVVRSLLEAGADPNAEDEFERAPLHWAAAQRATGLYGKASLWGEYAAIARMLLEVGADVNAVDDDGATPLFEALSEGNAVMVALLLEAGGSY